MAKRVLVLLVLSIFSFASSVSAAIATGQATVYKVTMNTLEIDNGAGSASITAFSGTSTTLDIASAADTNTSVGNFLSGLIVPDGSYSRVKPTPSGTFTVAGSVASGGTTYYTTSALGTQGCATNTTGPAQECTVTVNVGAQNWQDLPGTITVKDGAPDHKVRVKFNTSAALGLYNIGAQKEIMPEQPSVSVSLQ